MKQSFNMERKVNTTYTETCTETIQEEHNEETVLSLQTERTVSWSDDVIDNEFLCKKKSKVCCIYHKRKECPEQNEGCDSDDPNDYEII